VIEVVVKRFHVLLVRLAERLVRCRLPTPLDRFKIFELKPPSRLPVSSRKAKRFDPLVMGRGVISQHPLYRMVGSLGLSGSLAGVILPNLANAFDIFLMRQFIAGVPDDLIDAARVDGASELLILFKIVMPSIAPAIAALALFAYVYHWNSYLWPLTVLQGNSRSYPIVISLSRLLSYNRGAMNTNLVMAGATLAVLPPLVLFVLLQRFFVDSIVGSGVKG